MCKAVALLLVIFVCWMRNCVLFLIQLHGNFPQGISHDARILTLLSHQDRLCCELVVIPVGCPSRNRTDSWEALRAELGEKEMPNFVVDMFLV
jgi:hypothetical protein